MNTKDDAWATDAARQEAANMGADCNKACNYKRRVGCDFCGTGFCNNAKDCEPAPAGQEHRNQW